MAIAQALQTFYVPGQSYHHLALHQHCCCHRLQLQPLHAKTRVFCQQVCKIMLLTLYLPVVQINSGAKNAQTCKTLPTGAHLGPAFESTFLNIQGNPWQSVVCFRPRATPKIAKSRVLCCRREW
jgi:hypothetical protein